MGPRNDQGTAKASGKTKAPQEKTKANPGLGQDKIRIRLK